MTTHQTTFIGLLVALALAGGFVLYIVGRWIPLPGSKLLVLAPYTGLIMFMALRRIRSPWSMTLVSAVLAAVMSAVSPVMSLAIVTSGLSADLLARLIPPMEEDLRFCFAAALYPMCSFLLGLTATNYLTGRALFGAVGAAPFTVGALLSGVLGLAGAFFRPENSAAYL